MHEGGIATPLIARWPRGLQVEGGALERQPYQLVDVLPTLLEAAGATYPTTRAGLPVPPAEGRSMLPGLNGRAGDAGDVDLYWEHEGNSSVRSGRWKLVRKHGCDWELYAIEKDRAEAHDLAGANPDVVRDLAARYDAWAARCGVLPRQSVLDLYERRGKGLPPE